MCRHARGGVGYQEAVLCLSLVLEHAFKAQGGSSSVGLQQLGAMVIETKKWGLVAGQLQWGERILQQ